MNGFARHLVHDLKPQSFVEHKISRRCKTPGFNSVGASEPSIQLKTPDLRDQILWAITQLSDTVPRQDGLDLLLEMITSDLIELTGATSTFVHLVSEDDTYLELVSIAGQELAKVGNRLKLGEGMAGSTWQTGQYMYVEDYRNFSNRLTNLQFRIRQACALPMISDGRVFGILGIMFSDDGESFADHLDLLQQYTNLAGIAILNSTLILQTKNELVQSRWLNELSTATATTTNLESLFEVSAESLIRHFGAQQVDFWAIRNSTVECSMGAWQSNAGQIEQLSSVALENQRDDLIDSLGGKTGLSFAISKLSFASMSFFELASCEKSGASIFLLLDDGLPWCLMQTQFTRRSGRSGVLENLQRSAIGHISLTGRLHRVLEDAQFRADHDELTGLANRSSLNRFLHANTGKQTHLNQNIAFFFLDLDKFKEVNDSLGHAAGDQLLVETTARFKSVIPTDIFISRLGGDEFAMVACATQRTECENIANSLLSVFAEPFQIGKEIRIGASIGICLVNNSFYSAEDIMQCADEAMYQAKRSGKNCYAFSSNSLTHCSENKQLESPRGKKAR